MPERRVCTFCGNEIEPGTGKMYIKKDGTVYNFCSNKCQKNLLVLKRTPRRVRWTQRYEKRVKRGVEKKPKRPLAKIKKIEKAEDAKEEKESEKRKKRKKGKKEKGE